MHILILPSWYPNTYSQMNGVFFKEQAEALSKTDNKIGVIALTQVSIQDTIREKKYTFTNKTFIENEVITYLKEYPIIPKLSRKSKFCAKRREVLFKKMFLQYIEKEGLPDIIHLHSFFYGNLALWIKNKYHIPYVVTEHSTTFSRDILNQNELIYAKKVFKHASKCLAVSREFSSLLKEKIHIDFDYLPNIVNLSFFNQGNDTKSKDKSSFQFINIARLQEKKNHSMLIKSFKRAFSAQENIKLIIVGDGPEYGTLSKLIDSENLTKQITLYGFATREEVRDLLQHSDVFVLSSEHETFGVVLIEALSCGIPVVSTKSGGPESIIEENIGLLSEINEESLAESMKKMNNNHSRYDSNYLRDYTKIHFSEEAVIDKLTKIYKRILQ